MTAYVSVGALGKYDRTAIVGYLVTQMNIRDAIYNSCLGG